MTFDKQKLKTVGRYALLGAFLLLLSVLQNTEGYFPAFFSARAVLLIPAVVSLAMFENSIAAMLLGVFAGGLWDASASGVGGYAIYLLIVGFVCSSLINSVMRSNIITASLLSTGWLLIFFLGYWLIHYPIAGLDSSAFTLVRYYLPAFIYSAVLSPVIFLCVMALNTAINKFFDKTN